MKKSFRASVVLAAAMATTGVSAGAAEPHDVKAGAAISGRTGHAHRTGPAKSPLEPTALQKYMEMSVCPGMAYDAHMHPLPVAEVAGINREAREKSGYKGPDYCTPAHLKPVSRP